MASYPPTAMDILRGVAPTGATGASGAINSTTNNIGATGAFGGLSVGTVVNPYMGGSLSTTTAHRPFGPALDELPKDLAAITRSIRIHRRVYPEDHMSDAMALAFLRNRVIVTTVPYHTLNEYQPGAKCNSEGVTTRYTQWLDEFGTGSYMIDDRAALTAFTLLISFELEADLMQFVIALG